MSGRRLANGERPIKKSRAGHAASSATTDGAAETPGEPRSQSPFPIVGIGASAGGLEAFRELLRHLPLDTGMGFVLVQHLDPEHDSALTELLQRVTLLPVREVTNNLPVEPNHVYVIPPNTNLSITASRLTLLPRQRTRAPTRSIDTFLEALAEDQREWAIGVILSGTATDGTVGLEAIKAEGGITFAQDESAKYDSMPRSAVAAGCVDFVLSPEHIATELARIAKHPAVQGVPDESLTRPEDDRAFATALRDAGNGFKRILLLLRNHAGVDFSLYKSSTIQRRITRRLVLSKQNTPDDYAQFLRGNTKELDALHSDVLISVTSFFRNPEAFDVLQRTVWPELMKQRGTDPLRVWVLGCSTGQEAYSIAMAFTEAADKATRTRALQIFATDLNDALLDKARHGLYAKSVSQDLSPERLRRFFVDEEGGYRVSKALREMVVFARQNVISDPPFSRMDLISCRNLLIYFEPSLQKRVFPIFHYALKPGGYLCLGASESIGGFTELFEPIDKKHKIYAKKPAPTPAFRLPATRERGETRPPRSTTAGDPSRVQAADGGAVDGLRAELGAQHEADRIAVSQFAPPAVLINAELQVLQFRGPTGAYLEPPKGKASFDVLKMARNGLMLPLRAAINKANKGNRTVRKEGVPIERDGRTRTINLEVIPLKNLRDQCFLIVFEEADKTGDARPARERARTKRRTFKPPGVAGTPGHDESRRVAELETELFETRDFLQSIQEQHEAANEELQASNEEVQSANEELQSINEELETSKEELESANEELTTVNEEMANRNAELHRLNGDLVNIQTSAHQAIVLLGRNLAIRRFSPQAEKQFNLLAADVGRPFVSVRHTLEVVDLEAFIVSVIDTVRADAREVRDKDGHWFSLRVHPYMTLDNKVDGAVLVLVDIDALKRSEQAIAGALEYAENIIETVREPLLVLDVDLRVERANRSFYTTFRVTSDETVGRHIYDLGNQQWDVPGLRAMLNEVLARNDAIEDFSVTHGFERLGLRTMLLNARRIHNPENRAVRILVAIEDITARKQHEDALAESNRRKNEFLAMLAHELRNPLAPIVASIEVLRRAKTLEGSERLPSGTSADGSSATVPNVKQHADHALDVLRQQVGQMVRLVDDLLDAGRISRGKIDLRMEQVELSSVVYQVMEAVQPISESRNQMLTIALPSVPVYLKADRTRLAQIVGNLLNNASKFTDRGGHIWLTVERADELRTERVKGASTPVAPRVAIRVRDTGIGIAEDQIEHVFDMFTQVDTSLERSLSGLGIGLTLVKTLTELHGGTVEARSAGIDQGSEFVVILPIDVSTETAADELPAIEPALTTALRILIVDDNRDSADMLAILLKFSGHETHTAHDGLEAVEAAATLDPDIILLDIGLPQLNGYDVARKIRARRGAEGRPVLIALTGWGQEEDRRRGEEAGFDAHLVKPVDLVVLGKLLAGVTADKREV